jgi:phosphoribosylamine--glycine ligase
MRVLVVGSGGREHAIVWKLAQSSKVSKLYCAPGNAGISQIAVCIPIKANNIEKMVEFAKDNRIEMVVVGPDAPLAEGMIDAMEDNNIKAFGPRANAAILESSKVFAKEIMTKYKIPTADYKSFENSLQAIEFLEQCNYPIVIKADGLALGKGVLVANDFDEAEGFVKNIMDNKQFGNSGNKIIIEQFLDGVEVSILAFTDGKTIVPMVSSKDHKRAYDGDKGPNTGGMGTISPNPYYTKDVEHICMRDIYIPTIEAMNKEGRKFKGVLFIGLILTKDGPKVLEYNARFGDPETQVILPRLKTDLADIIQAVIDERLHEISISWSDKASVCIIASSGGYPNDYQVGYPIEGIRNFVDDDVLIFHAGTKCKKNVFYTSGGRVLGVTALCDNVESAAKIAYNSISKIYFKDMFYRKDIGINFGGSGDGG